MGKKSLPNCESLFLDSGVLIDLLKIDLSKSDEAVIKRVNQIKTFFESLTSMKGKRVYQFSTLSISEIFHLDAKHEELLKAISLILKQNDVETLVFDESAALFHNKEFYQHLSNRSIDEIKAEVNYPISRYANIRDRIRKDMLIAGTAKLYNSDIVLTTDGGFGSLCHKLGLNYHVFTGNPNDFIANEANTIIYDFQ